MLLKTGSARPWSHVVEHNYASSKPVVVVQDWQHDLISPSPPLPSACLPSPHPFPGQNCNFGVKNAVAKGKEKSLNIVRIGSAWPLWARSLLIDLAGLSSANPFKS